MKILVSADMGGAYRHHLAGDCEPGTEQWQRCRVMFTSDVNRAHLPAQLDHAEGLRLRRQYERQATP